MEDIMPVKKICINCNKEFMTKYLRKNIAKFCSKHCKYQNMRGGQHSEKTKQKMSISHKGPKHWNWKGGKTTHKLGYVYVLAHDHPFRNKDDYVFEHRLVMEKKLNRYLQPQERVHHINHIKNDNRIENLMLFANESEHHKFHPPSNGFKKGNVPWSKGKHYHWKLGKK
jgi:hypothetical protein